MDIADVLGRIERGDRQAFAEVVRYYQRPLFGFVGRMGLERHHAEEIAQEVFLRAWNNLHTYDGSIARFSTWIFTIARNLALKELQRSSRRTEVAGAATLEIGCDGTHAWDELNARDRKRKLEAALQRLSAADRSLIALAYVQELPMAELARMEGCSNGTLKVRLHRAKARLRTLLEIDDE